MLGLQRANIPGYTVKGSRGSAMGMVKLFSRNSNLCDHNLPTLQTDRGHAIAIPRFALKCIAR